MPSLLEAEDMFRMSIDMQFAMNRDDSSISTMTESLSALGRVLEDQGKLEEAERTYQKCLDIFREIHGMFTFSRANW